MQTKKFLIPLILAICVCAVPLLLRFSRFLDRWELGVYDILCRLHVEEEETSDLVSLIVIDSQSLKWGYRYFEDNENLVREGVLDPAEEGGSHSVDYKDYLWPWKRTVYEPIINFAAEGGARVVAFDMAFDTPHNSGDRDNEEALGVATLMSNEMGQTYVIQTISFHASENPPPGEITNEKVVACFNGASLDVEGIDTAPFPFHRSDEGIYYDPVLPYRSILIDGFEEFLRLGAVTPQPDPDSVIRRARILLTFSQWTFPSLGLGAALAYLESRDGPGSVAMRVDEAGLVLRKNDGAASERIPLTPSGDILVHYKDTGKEGYEGEGRFKTYPAFRVLLSAMNNSKLIEQYAKDPEAFKLNPEVFKDKIVFIGSTALGLFDLKAIPLAEKYPGVKIHAAVAENLLEGDPIRRMSETSRTLTAFLPALITLLCTLYARKTLLKFFIAAGILILYVGAGIVLFSSFLLWMDMVLPMIGLILAYTSGTTFNYFTEGRQKRRITRMFQHYVPPKVVDRIVADPEGLNTKGERVEITVFFSDIKSFTSLSNTPEMRENPDILTTHLNDYLTEMTGAIHDCGGTLDKYIGDAVVAFFGAPLPMDNHAREACRAALECQKRLAKFNQRVSAAGLPPLPTRIGLYTGEATVGNVGSEVRLSYTAIGSTVNFGSRLEGVNKSYGTWILAGDPTIQMAGESISARFLDRIRVPGVEEGAPPLKVYQVLAMADQKDEKDGRLMERFKQAMAHYESARFQEALPLFEGCAAEFDDPPSEVFAERCRQLLTSPPEQWDGVWRIKTK